MVIPLKLFLFAKIVNKYSIFHLKFLRNDSSAFIFAGRTNKHQPFNEPSSEMPKLLNVSKLAMIRDWSKSIGGGRGGPEHLEIWLIKNT